MLPISQLISYELFFQLRAKMNGMKFFKAIEIYFSHNIERRRELKCIFPRLLATCNVSKARLILRVNVTIQ